MAAEWADAFLLCAEDAIVIAAIVPERSTTCWSVYTFRLCMHLFCFLEIYVSEISLKKEESVLKISKSLLGYNYGHSQVPFCQSTWEPQYPHT